MTSRITDALSCPNCGEKGAAVWQADKKTESANNDCARTLVSLSGAFHQEAGRTTAAEVLIICNTCDEIQPQ